MSKKPQPKREIAIRTISKELRWIEVDSSPDALDDISEFGYLRSGQHTTLFVDARYDFDEVLDFIKTYGEQEPE